MAAPAVIQSSIWKDRLMKFTRPMALSIAAGMAISAFGVASTAFAEPVTQSYVAVGSDTLQDVLNGLANGTSITTSSVRSLAGSKTFGSYDATGSASIQTKSGGVRFGRPNADPLSGQPREGFVGEVGVGEFL
jgi:hypothetical protein